MVDFIILDDHSLELVLVAQLVLAAIRGIRSGREAELFIFRPSIVAVSTYEAG